jgi:Ca2+-binding EF-hand superfamily protein
MTEFEIDEMINHYDTDKDGKINFEEYLNLMMAK